MTKEINFFDSELLTSDVLPSVESTSPASPIATSMSEPKTSVTESRLAAMLERIQVAQESKQEESQAAGRVKKVIEALLFASNEPLSFEKLREITDMIYPFKPRTLQRIIQELQEEYLNQQRAFRLEEIADGYILRSCEEYGPYIEQLYRNRRGEKLSQPATEVLAIIAHRQPITRPAIDAIRGVDSSGIIYTLLERGLIEVVGRLEGPGRPSLYAVTQQFMQYFGLKDLKQLASE